MIHKLTIENFFSIADAQTIDFCVPGNAPQLPNFLSSRADKEVRVVSVAGLFGPNASGKSTVLRAIFALLSWVHSSFVLPPDGGIPFFHPHMCKDWLERPTKIDVIFDGPLFPDQEGLCRYELHIGYDAEKIRAGIIAGAKVLYEALSYAPHGRWRNIYKRIEQDFHFSEEFGLQKQDPRIPLIRSNASIPSTLAQLNHELSMEWVTRLKATQTNIAGYGKTAETAHQWLAFYSTNQPYLERLNHELRRLDLGIEAMHIKNSPAGLYAEFQHKGLDFPIHLHQESQGTQRFIEKFPRIQYALDTGGVVTIDELDNDMHPQILPEVFRWFGDPTRNPHKAQLIFAAHNPAILDELEKEQIFFTVKKDTGATEIYGAREIKGLRREPSLMKKYLGGELGALPVIG